jgi:hypothetical protein
MDVRERWHVARATRFLSHAWLYTFSDLVSALEAHAEESPESAQDAYFWIGVCTCHAQLALLFAR